jgi:hypothetical protein
MENTLVARLGKVEPIGCDIIDDSIFSGDSDQRGEAEKDL